MSWQDIIGGIVGIHFSAFLLLSATIGDLYKSAEPLKVMTAYFFLWPVFLVKFLIKACKEF